MVTRRRVWCRSRIRTGARVWRSTQRRRHLWTFVFQLGAVRRKHTPSSRHACRSYSRSLTSVPSARIRVSRSSYSRSAPFCSTSQHAMRAPLHSHSRSRTLLSRTSIVPRVVGTSWTLRATNRAPSHTRHTSSLFRLFPMPHKNSVTE